MIIKIIGVGISTVILSMILKQYKPEFSMLVNVCGGIIIFILCIDGLKSLIDSLIDLQSLGRVEADIVTPILKVIGVGYITEFASDIAEDSGNKSISNKIIFGGKIAICVLAIPIVKMLINAILSLL